MLTNTSYYDVLWSLSIDLHLSNTTGDWLRKINTLSLTTYIVAWSAIYVELQKTDFFLHLANFLHTHFTHSLSSHSHLLPPPSPFLSPPSPSFYLLFFLSPPFFLLFAPTLPECHSISSASRSWNSWGRISTPHHFHWLLDSTCTVENKEVSLYCCCIPLHVN